MSGMPPGFGPGQQQFQGFGAPLNQVFRHQIGPGIPGFAAQNQAGFGFGQNQEVKKEERKPRVNKQQFEDENLPEDYQDEEVVQREKSESKSRKVKTEEPLFQNMVKQEEKPKEQFSFSSQPQPLKQEAQIKHVMKCPFNTKVETLDLQNKNLVDLHFMEDLQNLKVLGLAYNQLDEEQLLLLKKNTQLEVLTFVGNKTTEKVFQIVGSCFPNLKETYLTSFEENQIQQLRDRREELFILVLYQNKQI